MLTGLQLTFSLLGVQSRAATLISLLGSTGNMPKLHHEPKLRPKLHLNHGNYKKTAADGGASSVSEVLTSTETCVRASEHLKTTDAVEYG